MLIYYNDYLDIHETYAYIDRYHYSTAAVCKQCLYYDRIDIDHSINCGVLNSMDCCTDSGYISRIFLEVIDI